MIRREYERGVSRAAKWAVPPAFFAPVLGLVAIIAHRTGTLGTREFTLVLATAIALALVGFILALIGLTSLWRSAAIGGRRSARALLFACPVLVPAFYALVLAQITAPLNDISTDTADPPHFLAPASNEYGANVPEPPRLDAAVQARFYPDATGRRYALSADSITDLVKTLVEERGWVIVNSGIRNDGDWYIEATAKTLVMGFMDDVIVRVTDEGESAYVDMRSTARFGILDLGGNATRISDFMQDLDFKVQSGAAE